MDVESARKRIDLIDCEIMGLLRQRMELALRLKRLKRAILEPERELKVLENVRACSRGIIGPQFAEELYASIMEESKRLQKEDLKLIGFQGEHGAYSEVAARTHDPSMVPIPCKEFSEVFMEVEAGQLDYGIVPVENSLEGAVTEVNDLLTGTEAKIVGEITIPIHHCLLALPGTDLQEVKAVYSHPQALAQCRGFMATHKMSARPFYDTAGASKMLSEERLETTGVIASALCAELYRLEIIERNIEDNDSNSTRFIVLSRESALGSGRKCSILFSVSHEAGTLSTIMNIFSEKKINLTRIESRPQRSRLGRYTFFLDLEGSDTDQRVVDALRDVESRTLTYKFLGCYGGKDL